MASLSDPLVKQFLEGRYIATLATKNPDGCIHMVAVWYWYDGKDIYVATSTRTRKAKNLQSDSSVSLMIDSRDPAASCGVTIMGNGTALTGGASRKVNEHVHRKYLSEAAMANPKVGPLFAAWDDMTIQIAPASVVAWDMREADKHGFDGTFAANPGYLLEPERSRRENARTPSPNPAESSPGPR
jgi:nitroimidazol reductase NimA-like FMN-containing flavoprotein (pyridoxamine 5'-phosphate oxidase superfamily)